MIRSLGGYLLFAGRVKTCLEEIILQAIGPILRDLFEGVAELFVREPISFVKQLAKIAEYLLDRLDVAFVAVYENLVPTRTDINFEQRFEIFDVLILYAEKRVEALRW